VGAGYVRGKVTKGALLPAKRIRNVDAGHGL
jgi:hypothetical protein